MARSSNMKHTNIKAPLKADICNEGLTVTLSRISNLIKDHVVIMTTTQIHEIIRGKEGLKVKTLFEKLTFLAEKDGQIAIYAGVGNVPDVYRKWNRFTDVSYGVAHNGTKRDKPWLGFKVSIPTLKTDLLTRLFAATKPGQPYPLGDKPLTFRLRQEKETLNGTFFQGYDGRTSPINLKKFGKPVNLREITVQPGTNNPIVFRTVDNEEYLGTLDVQTRIITLPNELTL